MKIPSTYKSHIIALIVSVLINVIFISLLSINAGFNLFKDKNELIDDDLTIQLQLLEELAQSLPSSISKSMNVKSTEPQTIESDEKTDVSDKLTTNAEDVSNSQRPDSLLIEEMKKIIVDVKDIAMIDTTPKVDSVEIENPIQNPFVQPKKVIDFEDERRFYAENYKTIQRLKVVYPYVMKTKILVDKLNAQLVTINDKQERKRIIKVTEKELFMQFEKDVRKMSYSQGKILLKLLARETNESAYELIKNYKGGLPANFWYAVGLVFQEDLKVKYDSLREDAMLEKIVKKYNDGKLK